MPPELLTCKPPSIILDAVTPFTVNTSVTVKSSAIVTLLAKDRFNNVPPDVVSVFIFLIPPTVLPTIASFSEFKSTEPVTVVESPLKSKSSPVISCWTKAVVAIVVLFVPVGWVTAVTLLLVLPSAAPAIEEPTFTIPVKLPKKSTDVILVKFTPTPEDIVIDPSVKEPNVAEPVPFINVRFCIGWLTGLEGSVKSWALLLIFNTAPKPAAPPATMSTMLCIVKFFVGLSGWLTSVPKTKSSAVGGTVGYEYIIAMLY